MPATALRLFLIPASIYREKAKPACPFSGKAGFQNIKTSGGVEGRWSALTSRTRLHD
jgi:hypothetical protein